jgi:hypothetical protein
MTVLGAQFTFCDDVRMEIGGKMSIMGVYKDFIAIHGERAIAPKLVTLFSVDYDESQVGTEARLQLMERDRELISVTLSLPPRQPSGLVLPEPVANILHLVVPAEFAGLQLEAGMVLRASVVADDQRFDSESLYVVAAPAGA